MVEFVEGCIVVLRRRTARLWHQMELVHRPGNSITGLPGHPAGCSTPQATTTKINTHQTDAVHLLVSVEYLLAVLRFIVASQRLFLGSHYACRTRHGLNVQYGDALCIAVTMLTDQIKNCSYEVI